MGSPQNWFIDFDDTLATGSMTWALQSAFPKLIRQYQLPTDGDHLRRAVFVAQERSSRDVSPQQVVHELFETLAWPYELEQVLFEDMLTNYQPALFDDARTFLQRLQSLNKQVYILSNNPLSHKSVVRLEIDGYLAGIHTPSKYPGTLPKPHRSLWDVIVAAENQVTAENSAFVGDDPWTDGGFAENCGMACWIVDRQGRFADLDASVRYRRVSSLLDIPLT